MSVVRLDELTEHQIHGHEPIEIKDISTGWKAVERWCADSILGCSSMKAHFQQACKSRSSSAFSGDDRMRQTVEMKWKDLLALYVATATDSPHWAKEIEDLHFYVCQCPLFSAIPDVKCILPSLMDDIIIPNVISPTKLLQVNLWMSFQPSRSTIHFDAYQNILAVIRGRKIVTLYPPSAVSKLRVHPVFAKSANHSTISLHRDGGYHDKESHLSCGLAKTYELGPGDALFIPEGWWHQVDSEMCTIAVNFWFKGVGLHIRETGSMASFYGRLALEKLVEQRKETALKAVVQSGKKVPQLSEISENSSAQDIQTAVNFLADDQTDTCVLLQMDWNAMRIVFPKFADEFPSRWKSCLEGALPVVVEHLTDTWEKSDGCDARFFELIFKPFEGQEQEMQQSLLRRKDQFSKECCKQVLTDTFGIC